MAIPVSQGTTVPSVDDCSRAAPPYSAVAGLPRNGWLASAGITGWFASECPAGFRRNTQLKQTGLQVRPMFHWTPRRIDAHVKLCVLALQMQRAAEIRCNLSWARVAHVLGGLKAVRYRCEGRGIVQRTKILAELAAILKNLGVSVPKQLLAVEDPPPETAAA
jgi:hypothetical protein